MPTPEPDRMLSSPAPAPAPAPAPGARLGHALISGPDQRVGRDRVATWVAVLTGVTFVFAGLVKFAFHHWELHAFRSFGLPWPSALEVFAGALEMAAGTLLALRLAVVPVAVLLAATMVVAIISSGIGHGDVIPSLTLAPTLLLAMLFLLFRGLGAKRTRSAQRAPGDPPADWVGTPAKHTGPA